MSVVVLSWNNRDLIDGCLDSVRSLHWPDYEIIVVDNGSRDGSVAHLRSMPDIRLLVLPRNRGFAGGQVAARSLVHGEFVALVNSDAFVASDWLEQLMPAMEDRAVGAAGGRAYDLSDGQAPGRRDGTFASYQVVNPRTGETSTVRSGECSTDVDSLSGAAVLIRTAAMDAVGGFDAKFFAYYEETDLFARMIRAGNRLRYVPTAHAWHRIRGSTVARPDFYDYFMIRNRALFFVRNFDRPYLRAACSAYAAEVLARLRDRDRRSLVTLRALASLLVLLPHALRSRRQIRILGHTYCARLPSGSVNAPEERR